MLLSFEKVSKVMTEAERIEKYTSDSHVPGTYVPNMSKADMRKWKGKHVKGKDERVEIRKSVGGVQMVVIVYKEARKEKDTHYNGEEYEYFIHKNVHISANGKISLDKIEHEELNQVIAEANYILHLKPKDVELEIVGEELLIQLNAMPEALKNALNSLEIEPNIFVNKILNPNGHLYLIKNRYNMIYSKIDREFYGEILPSNRDEQYFEEFRYKTMEEAIIDYFKK